jgi:hypothetical protein
VGRFQHVEPTSRVHVSLKEGRSRPDACEPLIWPSPQMQAGASAMLVISIPFGVQKLGFQPTRFMSMSARTVMSNVLARRVQLS